MLKCGNSRYTRHFVSAFEKTAMRSVLGRGGKTKFKKECGECGIRFRVDGEEKMINTVLFTHSFMDLYHVLRMKSLH